MHRDLVLRIPEDTRIFRLKNLSTWRAEKAGRDVSLAVIEEGDGLASSKCSRQAALRLPQRGD